VNSTINITPKGLLAGERFLRDNTEEFYDGTPEGFHLNFIQSLVAHVLCASGITLYMPDQPQVQPDTTDPLTVSIGR
jgi:hypothetical protein